MTDKPNIVLVSWDSVRADHIPMQGYDRNTTPFLESQIEDALVFENTHAPAVGTPASFSGVFSGEHSAGSMMQLDPEHWRQANSDRTLLAEHLQDEGYHTGAFHVNALMSAEYGWDRGWDVYSDGMWDKEPGESAESSDSDESGFDVKRSIFNQLQKVDMAHLAVHLKKIATGEHPVRWEELWPDIEDFVSEAPEPWFLWVLLIDTHHPYFAPLEHQKWEQPGVRGTYATNFVMLRDKKWVGERRQSVVNAYDNTYRYADKFVERLTDTLEQEGYGDDPFIFHSDHGDELGEHANYGHRPLMYNTVTQVPLMMWNVGETGRRDGPHSLLDLGNAILELAGSDTRMGEGKSLLSDDRKVVQIQNLLDEYGRCAAAVGDEWKVLYHPEGDWGHGGYITPGREAYNIEDDPMEKNDRYGEHPQEIEDALDEQLASTVSIVDEEEAGMSGDVQERLSELGYLE